MNGPAEKETGKKPGTRCPMCGRPYDELYRPFCSKRCANIDLSRWLSGGYVIPGNAADEEGDDAGLPSRRDFDDEDDKP